MRFHPKGRAGAQQFLMEKMPQWIEQFGGPNHEPVAFFCTNDAQAEPVIKCVAASKNAIFVEPGSASPLLGYPGALGLNLFAERGNWPAIMKKVEAGVIARGAGGRMGDWAYSSNYSFVAGLVILDMKMCVKFCGNCNPHAHMPSVLQAVAGQVPSVELVPWDQADYEILLILCGCPAGCAQQPAFAGRTVFVTSRTVDHWPVAEQELVGKVLDAIESPGRRTMP